jgi:hypothetical protein
MLSQHDAGVLAILFHIWVKKVKRCLQQEHVAILNKVMRVIENLSYS